MKTHIRLLSSGDALVSDWSTASRSSGPRVVSSLPPERGMRKGGRSRVPGGPSSHSATPPFTPPPPHQTLVFVLPPCFLHLMETSRWSVIVPGLCESRHQSCSNTHRRHKNNNNNAIAFYWRFFHCVANEQTTRPPQRQVENSKAAVYLKVILILTVFSRLLSQGHRTWSPSVVNEQ